MLNTVGDIITEVLVRNNRTTTDTFITDAMLQDWMRQAHVWSASYKKWPFTEMRDRTQAFSVEEIPYSSFTAKFKADSIRLLQIGGSRLQKLEFRNYQIFREELPTATDRVFTDFQRTLYINPNIDLSGTVTAWGQYEPTIDPTDTAATTIFSTFDEEGNEAIVEKMSSYLKRREHTVDEAELNDARAQSKLEAIWEKIIAEQYQYQTHPSSGGQWKRFDVLRGAQQEEFRNPDQF